MTKIDYDILASLSVDIGRYFKKITEYVPKEKEFLLKNIASASIHMALFMQDVYGDKEGTDEPLSDIISEFLEKCGCQDWSKK